MECDSFFIEILPERLDAHQYMDYYYVLLYFRLGFVAPILGFFMLIITPERFKFLWQWITLFTFSYQLWLHYWIFSHLYWNSDMAFYQRVSWIDFGLFTSMYGFVLDGSSGYFYIIVPGLLLLCTFFARPTTYRSKLLYAILMSLDLILLNAFLAFDYLQFFVFLELSILPMFLLISIWGSRTRRSYAAYTYFFFSMFASVFFLVAVIIISSKTGSTCLFAFYDAFSKTETVLDNISEVRFDYRTQLVVFALLFLSLAIKMPIFPFHIWLPEAHGEASTIGSVILAGLFLKLSGFGIFRFILPFFPDAYNFFKPYGFVIGILGLLYGSIILFRQLDIKKFIAYSSVVHMNLMVVALFSSNSLALEGAYYSMIIHSVVASLLFFLAGIIYDRYHTRIVFYMSDLSSRMPTIASLFYFALLSNVAFPLTANFIAELFMLSGIFKAAPIIAVICVIGISLLSISHFFLINKLVYGDLPSDYKLFYVKLDGSDKEKSNEVESTKDFRLEHDCAHVRKYMDDSSDWDGRVFEVVPLVPLLFFVVHMNYFSGNYFYYFEYAMSTLPALLTP